MTKNIVIKVGDFEISNDKKLVFFGGPCQMETEEHSLFMAKSIKEICDRLNMNFVFKTSFDKANRTAATSKRGMGIDAAVDVFKEIKKQVGCPIVTDFHTAEQFKHPIVDTVDVVQVPAFLCRQTDLLQAAAETGKPVQIKKGQFISPRDTHNIFGKMKYFGNTKVILCDRGSCFGYNALVNDMTCYPIMAETGCPVCCDATHSAQIPGGGNGCSSGNREMAEYIARAATAVGIAVMFMEVHQDPDKAPSDGPNMIRLDQLERILKKLLEIDAVIKVDKKTTKRCRKN